MSVSAARCLLLRGGWRNFIAETVDRGAGVATIAPSLSQRAQVAELVDALGSGPSGGNIVEVRVLSWAPIDVPAKAEVVRETP